MVQIAYAQQEQQVANTFYQKDPIKKKWKALLRIDSNAFQLSFFDKNDVPQETISFADKDFTIKNGPFSTYENGKISQKGSFLNNKQNGQLSIYDTSNQTISTIYTYRNGLMNGKFISYWSADQAKSEGVYLNDKKAGSWRYYYKTGEVAAEEFYKDGDLIAESYFLKNGEVAQYSDLFSPPTYQNGIDQFYRDIVNYLEYPEVAQKKNVQGEVKLSFMINEDGSISDVKVVESPDYSLTEAAKRAFKHGKNWLPGKYFGEYVETRFSIPIKFSLQR